MQKIWLIAGPPGCGKTNWILHTLREFGGPCAYLRLDGFSHKGLTAGVNAGVDRSWLSDQIPQLQDLSSTGAPASSSLEDGFVLIEAQQFRVQSMAESDGIDPRIQQQLDRLNLKPDRTLLFGRDSELPRQDTLEFTQLESWHLNLHDSVWDSNSLSSFWFELVNGAYGDVYRAKALMNLPDGRSFFCNWMVSQDSSQFLPLETVEPPTGRPTRRSHLVVQGKALNQVGIKNTIHDCLLDDDVFEMQQAQRRQEQPDLLPT